MGKPSIWNFLRDPESQRSVGNGLLDAANRGMVANSLGSLVDLSTNVANLGIAGAGYIGHKTGLLSQPPDLIDSRNVPGSSEWIGQKMQNAGMVSPNRNALAEFGMGLLSPVAYKGAQKVGGLLYNVEQNALANASKPSTMRMHGQRGIFAGEWAKTADKNALSAAKKMEADKAAPRAIWSETGWFKAPDGKWRFEIDDSASLVKSSALPEKEFFASGQSLGTHADFKLSDSFDHSKVFEAYPDAKNIEMSFADDGNRFGGSYKPGLDWISMDAAYKEPTLSSAGQSAVSALSAELNALKTSRRQTRYDALTDAIFDRNGENFLDPRLVKVVEKFGTPLETKRLGLLDKIDDAKESMTTGVRLADSGRSTLLHELQHAIQKREGFAVGGSPEDFPDAETLSTAHILAIRMRRGELPSEAAAWVRDNTNKNPTPQAIDLAMGGADLLRKLGDSPSSAYRRLAGEAEARAVQSRMNMSEAQRRASFPLDSYDVPLDSLIIKY